MIGTVLITGAGGGLGGATATLFAERGWTVLAADLTKPSATPGVIPLEIDVTDTESVRAAVAEAEHHAPGGLDAVVTFAGIMRVGSVVEIDEEELRQLIDVNLLGTYRVVKAAFPLIQRRRGRVITISSETGWQKALMLNGPYAITKHAVEAYSDALRRELMFLDIPVSTIRPGPFRTDMVNGIDAAFDHARSHSTLFPDLIGRVGALAAKEQARAHDPAVLADVVWKAATTARPRAHYSVRADLRRSLLHHIPSPVVDRLLKAMFTTR
ncbi:SDR family NAD(P)-dependent oxidoreductase [Williamsia sp.]|uniref:SDR family NAD(P)-dependent oxidoreductase n=1 Tax=Williamsia sp. TaxID=1872085 RepID=UPI001A2743BE|nr:SDR family NAD(P)-dependent oxidoreductase [Williamsia sp.]MBJ7289362.1 SDR family NAD(P)-dependent oxidoreductase [Williamsia sp.]